MEIGCGVGLSTLAIHQSCGINDSNGICGGKRMEPIIPAFEISLLDPSLSDVIMDIAELGIDIVVKAEKISELLNIACSTN